LKNFARDEGKMGIEHVTQQDFGSGIDDDDAHVKESD